MWLGTAKHFLVFPVRAGTLINFVGFVPPDEEMKDLVGARRSRCAARGIRRLGPAHRGRC